MKHERSYDGARKGTQTVTLRLGAEYYGIPVANVREILRPLDLFPVPGMGASIEGVINLRGEIIPIVKIHLLLGTGPGECLEALRKRRMIIIDASCGSFGFFVDEVLLLADKDMVVARAIQVDPGLGVGWNISFESASRWTEWSFAIRG